MREIKEGKIPDGAIFLKIYGCPASNLEDMKGNGPPGANAYVVRRTGESFEVIFYRIDDQEKLF